MTPYERLLAEELPTGDFGGPRPTPPPPPAPTRHLRETVQPTATAEALARAALLDKEAAAYSEAQRARRARRHLRPVPDPPQPQSTTRPDRATGAA